MARIAGLQVKHCWSDWDRSDFTQANTKGHLRMGQTMTR